MAKPITTKGPGDFDPPDDPPAQLYKCDDCDAVFSEDEMTGKCCPHCDSEEYGTYTYEPEPDDPSWEYDDEP